MATRRIVLEDGSERIYRNAVVFENRGCLMVEREAGYTPSKTTDDPFKDIFLSDADTQVTETLAQYPSGTWKYWETVEAE